MGKKRKHVGYERGFNVFSRLATSFLTRAVKKTKNIYNPNQWLHDMFQPPPFTQAAQILFDLNQAEHLVKLLKLQMSG